MASRSPSPEPSFMPLNLRERMAIMDRADALAMAEKARQAPAQLVAALMAEAEATGQPLPRSAVEQAVKELVAGPAALEPPVPAGEQLVRRVRGVLIVVGMCVVGLIVLRILFPLIERLLGALL